MRKITKIKRSIRAISPVISVLLMIAIAVVASLVVYAWVMGYIGGKTTQTGNAIQIQSQSYTSSGNLTLYVQNTGQGLVHLKQDGSVYVNDVLHQITQSPAILGSNDMTLTPGQLIPINVGQTVQLVIDCPYHSGDRIKVVTIEGTFMQTSGTGTSGGSSGTGGSGGSTTQSPVASFTFTPTAPNVGVSVTFTDTSTAGSGTINQWSWSFGDGVTSTAQNPTHSYSTSGQETVSLTVTDSNSKTSTTTQTVQVNSVTPTPTPTTPPGNQFQVTFAASPSGSGNVNPTGTQTYTASASVPITATATNGYTFSSWTFSGSIQITNPVATSTTAQINGAGSITANFISSTSQKLVFTAGASQTLLVGQPSSVITVQRQTASGTAITSGTTTVTLTATSGAFYSDAFCTTQISSVSISSGSTASFYYEASATGTPTLTASATNYASVSTTFTINTGTPTVVLNSSFDGSGTSWQNGWDNWANPPWNVATDYYYSAPQSIKSTQSNEGPFSCNPIDATGAKYITVTFEFMIYQTQSTQFQIRYSGVVTNTYNNNNFILLASLGDTTAYPASVWHQYTVTIADTSAFTTDFRISFLSQTLNSRAAIWVDNVVITVNK
jgi:PKD repeat protein